MKNIFTIISLLFITISAFGQAPFKPVKVDSLVTVSLPASFQKKDTLGQHIYSANAMYGYITVIIEPNGKNNAPLKKEGDLNGVMKKYIKSIQHQATGGSAQNVRDTTVGRLKAKLFTLFSKDDAENVQYINFILMYTTETTYTFEYVYPENRKDLIRDEYKAFASSIKLSPELKRNDQYLSMTKGMSLTVMIALIAGAILIVVLLVIFIIRRKKTEEV